LRAMAIGLGVEAETSFTHLVAEMVGQTSI
jgi:hypothetical protein